LTHPEIVMYALVTNIQGYSIHDGPGIRTTVFLKGCGLACRWCANPECISPGPEVGFIKTLCTRCGACVGVCQHEALDLDAKGTPRIARMRCVGCGQCARVCAYKALVVHGKQMSVDEVFDAVSADKMFYGPSGGGVTVSGGEPLLQPRFVRELFDKCREAGIHTCIETSGCAAPSALAEVLPSTDHVLADLKLIDSLKHRQFTGQPNDLILSNARVVVESNVEFLFRMPLISGINDTPENIRETGAFLKSLGSRAERIELMPYHRLGESKYIALNKRYRLHGLPPIDPVQVEAVRQAFEKNGILCSVST
jgi:pyruvate formate lyase activating enzyme